MGEGAAVAEGDELGEGVGALGPADEGGVADLLVGGGVAARAEGAGGGEGEHGGGAVVALERKGERLCVTGGMASALVCMGLRRIGGEMGRWHLWCAVERASLAISTPDIVLVSTIPQRQLFTRMGGTTTASRRFYHAFYRWSVVGHTIRPSCRPLSTSTNPLRDNGGDAAAAAAEAPLFRRQFARTPQWRKKGNAETAQQGNTPSKHETTRQPSSPSKEQALSVRARPLAQMPVLTTDEKPFDTFHPWYQVVRYRSEVGVLLQIAVPAVTLRDAQRLYGTRLEKAMELGARLEIGNNVRGHNGEDIVSVTLSGTFGEVQRARDFFSSIKPARWMQHGPRSEAHVPSSQLEPYIPVLREAYDDGWSKIQVAVPSHEMDELSKRITRNDLEKKCGVRIDTVPPPASEVISANHSLYISGGPLAVVRAFQALPRSTPTVPKTSTQGGQAGHAVFPSESTAASSNLCLQLRVPAAQSTYVIGKSGSRLRSLQQNFMVSCIISNVDSTIYSLYGADEAQLRRAKAHIQILVDEVSRKNGITSVDVQELGFAPASSFGDPLKAQSPSQTVSPTYDVTLTENHSTDRVLTGGTPDNQAADSIPRFFAVVSTPLGPEGERNAVNAILGQEHHRIREMTRPYGIKYKVSGNGAKLKLHGPSEESVRRAANQAQEIAREAYTRANFPAMQFKELQTYCLSRPRESTAEKSDKTPAPEQKPDGAAAAAAQPDAADSREDVTAVSADDMKLGLGMLTHPVVLVTSRIATREKLTSPEDHFPFCRGVTVSSFNSVTVGPTPMVSFNIRTPSRTWDAISSTGRLSAHILAATPAAATLTDIFTRPYERPDDPIWLARRLGAYVSLTSDTNRGVSLSMRDAVACIMHCRLDPRKSVQVGDHKIVVAHVKRIFFPNTSQGDDGREAAASAVGLAYAKRGYRGVGERIEVEAVPDAEDVAQHTAPRIEEAMDERVGVAVAEVEAVEAHPSTTEKSPQAAAPGKKDVDFFEAFQKDEDDETPELSTSSEETASSEPPSSDDTSQASTPSSEETAPSDPLMDEIAKNERLSRFGNTETEAA